MGEAGYRAGSKTAAWDEVDVPPTTLSLQPLAYQHHPGAPSGVPRRLLLGAVGDGGRLRVVAGLEGDALHTVWASRAHAQ